MKTQTVQLSQLHFFPKTWEAMGEAYASVAPLYDIRSARPVDKKFADLLKREGQQDPVKVVPYPGMKGNFFVVSGSRRIKALRHDDETNTAIIEVRELDLVEGWTEIKQLQISSNAHSPSTMAEVASDMAALQGAGKTLGDIAKMYNVAVQTVRNYLGLQDEAKFAPELLKLASDGVIAPSAVFTMGGASIKQQRQTADKVLKTFSARNAGATTMTEAETKAEEKAAKIKPTKAANGKVVKAKAAKVKRVAIAEIASRESLKSNKRGNLSLKALIFALDEVSNVPTIVNNLAVFAAGGDVDEFVALNRITKAPWVDAFVESLEGK